MKRLLPTLPLIFATALLVVPALAQEAADGTANASLTTSDQAFLARLGLIRGHLRVGNALYQQGHTEMSATHMKHPRDELYAGLVPAITARGGTAFDAELSGLADAVESGAGAAEVQAAWERVDSAIASIEIDVGAPVSVELMAMADMLDTAAEEYAVGVVDGQIENVHEYQDAWGFTQVVGQRLERLQPADEAERRTLERMKAHMTSLDGLWPSLAPEDSIPRSGNRLPGIAHRFRAFGNSLDR